MELYHMVVSQPTEKPIAYKMQTYGRWSFQPFDHDFR